MTDHRRAWIDLAEGIRTYERPETSIGGLLKQIMYLPVTQDVREALLDTITDAILTSAHFPGSFRPAWSQNVAMILAGHPDFDVSRFLHHARSDNPNGKWSYQVANPEGEWARDPEDPVTCLKIGIETA